MVCQLSQPVKQVHWHRQWFEWLPQSVKNRVSTAALCVVLQKAATDLPTMTTSKWSFGNATRGHFMSMVQAVGACSLPPCNFYFESWWTRYRFLPQKPPMSCLARSSLNWRREWRLDDGWRGKRRYKIIAFMIATSRMNHKRYLHHLVHERPEGQ